MQCVASTIASWRSYSPSVLLVATAAMAHADPYVDALAGFTDRRSSSDTGEAINKVVASGNPLAAQLLPAAEDARLMFSAEQKKVYIKTKDGKLLDAATGNRSPARRPTTSTTSISITGCAA